MDPRGTFWLPEAASSFAGDMDALFMFVIWVTSIIFLLVVAAMGYFVTRYRRRHANERTTPVRESHVLEVAWVTLPTILSLLVFTWGFKNYVVLNTAPPDSYEIVVKGKKWFWEFHYPNGFVSVGELVVPQDRPVKLRMMSEDVLHSFFIPAFRVKQDVLPNRYTSLWFEATRADTFQVFCTEYCGTQHSGMLAEAVVMDQADFDTWLSTNSLPEGPSVEYGVQLYEQFQCQACHSIDGSRKVGPTFLGLWGDENHEMSDGSTVVVDENYIRESILMPNAKIVAGYPAAMPANYSEWNEVQIESMIAWMKTLE
jgi:cytochrome c oxidase subunit 2